MILQVTSHVRRVDNRGSITVEATISLVTFFLTIVSVLSMISICRVQYCIGRALKAAALDVSRYSYFYYAVGGYHSVHSVKRSVAELITDRSFSEDGRNGMEELVELTQILFGEEGSTEDEYRGSIFSTEDTAPVIIALLSECVDELSSAIIAAPIARSVFHKKLGLSDTEADRYLKANGVIDGWNGLDFGMSKLFPSESPLEVSLCVRYSIRIPFLGGASIRVIQRAVTYAWLGGDRTVIDSNFNGSEGEYLDGEFSDSIWSMSAFDRGQLFKEIFSKQYKDSDSISGMRGVIGYESTGNIYHNCVSINTFSESYYTNDFRAAAACEHTIRKLKITIDEVQGKLAEGERATISYTVIIPEDADSTSSSEIDDYLKRRAEQFHEKEPSIRIIFKIVRAGGKAEQ
jgi:hypothetical protein